MYVIVWGICILAYSQKRGFPPFYGYVNGENYDKQLGLFAGYGSNIFQSWVPITDEWLVFLKY